MSYVELDRRARAVAAELQTLGIEGERVLLLLAPGLEYLAAFFGCLYAGAIAVPAYPPRGRRGLPRLVAVLDNCEPRCVLSSAALLDKVERYLATSAEFRDLLCLEVDEMIRQDADRFQEPAIDGETLAFLQYTSGSTSTPKGVEISHRNLIANQRMIQATFGTTRDSIVVSWLPLYHDMGLIGGLLHPVYTGAHCVFFAPIHFLQRPGRWLEAISKHRASVSGAPNFAYDLCSRRLDSAELSGVDLRPWRLAFNGAEPVRRETLEKFADTFAGAGFRREAFFPCYGLAEATLLVAGGHDRDFGAAQDDAEVSSGDVPDGLEVKCVDPETRKECAPGTVGEIWVAGASVARGYWKRPEASAETFGAHLADGNGPFLRTGDLGQSVCGKLHIVGRIKDLIIIRGRNLYPQDIEWTAENSHPAARPGGAAAFTIDEAGEERLVVVQEVEPRQKDAVAELAEAVRESVAAEHEVRIAHLLMVKAGGVPKTTSGKVRRRTCRDQFLAGELPSLGEFPEDPAASAQLRLAPRNPTEERIAALWEEILDVAPGTVGALDNFFALGGDSLRGSQLLARLEEREPSGIDLEDLFQAPTVAALARKLTAKAARSEPRRAIERVERGRPLPVTSAQRRLWFLDQLEPGNPAYNLAVSLRMTGGLDFAALEAGLAEIVRRHEALRTVFRVVSGTPSQLVRETRSPLPLCRVDLDGLADAAPTARALARASARLPFDLAQGPLVRMLLVRLQEREHELSITLHHIISDGWSIGVLLRELRVLYEAFSAGRPSPLAELPVQYADFACWHEERLGSDEDGDPLDGWRQRLAGRLPVLELPADRPRRPTQSFRGAHAVHRLPAPTVDGLRALATAHDSSLFMVLLAGYQALVHRWTGAGDLIVGTAVANRDRVELEGLIGFFVNTLPLRTDLGGKPTFLELLGRARETVLGAFVHRDVPFERLVNEFGTERDLSRMPIVQTMLVLQNAPLEVGSLPELRLVAEEIDNHTARFDLAVSLIPAPGGLSAVLKYSRDLFDPATILRLARHFERLLEGASASPGSRLSELPLISAAERQQVVVEWNATKAPELLGGTLHELFEAQVDRSPEAVALVFEDQVLTYQGLDRRANRLAHRLLRMGAGPESLVGVAAERSPELVIALYGVLKAGGAYLPLDPSYPRERLAFMVDDARIAFLLAVEATRSKLVAPPNGSFSSPAGRVRTLLLDREDLRGERGARPGTPVDPGNAAYTIYTSGSTGRPKGSTIPHRGIVNRLRWMQRAYGLSAGEGVLQKTPASFDVSVWEFFWPLLVGARLILARPGGHKASTYLCEVISREKITTLHFVPSMLQVFLADPRAGQADSLTRVMVSGEALPRELERRFAALSKARLHNLYGPTEASVDVTSWACGGDEDTALGVPIGRPIQNISIHLLGRDGAPVPVGVAGHLHIGGAGLARGYLRRPGLSAERFVPDPLAGGGRRLYATGDLARTRVDGAIDFLGRLDHQIKIRGLRIELGEIEAAVNAHDSVRESVLVARSGDAGDRRLVAYLVAQEGASLDVRSLREFLAERLPDYMVPALFVVLDALPLNPSGKVDRKALPPPGDELRSETPWIAPRTALEERVAKLWQEQLGISRIGVEHDFFELGGDSIRGALFINRIQSELNAVVYVMALFDHPTVARFSAYLEESYREELTAAGWLVESTAPEGEEGRAAPIGEGEIKAFSTYVKTRFSPPETEDGSAAPKNRPAIFLLSPFRSGSTLLRVMLGGHPHLFAPPELELLGFLTMGERSRVFSGRDRFSGEGLLRAVMELRGCDAPSAAALVGEAEERDEPTRVFFRRLQDWAGKRVLVDKTPRYALDLPSLERAERFFEDPLYVHLVRHPQGTISSYLEAKMQEVYRFPLSARRQAEVVWRRCHENILEHLAAVPPRRQHRLHFEDLVQGPEAAMRSLSFFLGLEFDPAMLSPYEGRRMTDGLHSAGRMMGDPKFHRHQKIEAGVADRWRKTPRATPLDEATRELAERLAIFRPPAAGARAALPARPISRSVSAGDDLPLSFAQERIWFLDRLEPGGNAYGMPAAVRLTGRLDPAALKRAMSELERRHDVLRAVFPTSSGRPRQTLRPASAALLPIVDLGALPLDLREARAGRLVAEEAQQGFDLASGPLWRLSLLRLSRTQHILRIHLHHIICDGWSVGILTRELAALYSSFCRNLPPSLPALPLRYADFAAWQRDHLTGEVLEEHLAYWHRRLDGAPPLLQLPIDRPRPAVETHRGAHLGVEVPPALAAYLRSRAREAGATLFMALVAAFQTLLRHYSAQDDVVIGTPVANRHRAEVEGLLGLFVNTLVLRGDLSGDPELGVLLRRVRQVVAEASRHEELPFEKLVDGLGVERSLDHAPLFVVMLALQNNPPAALSLPDLTMERLEVKTPTAKFDLTLDLTESEGGALRGLLEYNVDLFDRTTVARLARHFQNLLEGWTDPKKRLSELPLLSREEEHELQWEANDTREPFRTDSTLDQLWRATARRQPKAVAISFEGHDLRYAALAERAERLARFLAGLGVEPEVRVGICAERSPALLVGLLAVLEAGGTYVPLDPLHPPERLAYILADAEARFLLTEKRLLSALPENDARVVLLDDEPPEVESPPPRRPRPENLAYLIYTSGSTGRPKGVEIPHRTVVNYLTSMPRRPGLGEGDVMIALTTLSFDIAVTELLLPLVVGARIEMLSRETAADAVRLAAAIDAAQATAMQATPATWTLLVEGRWPGRQELKALCGGEALPRPLADRLLGKVGELWNVYGPTETTVWSTLAPVGSGQGQVPIGRPLGNTSIHLLGRDATAIPKALIGELLIGGAGVGRGYSGRPALSAERFVPDPFGDAGARLYRTGDLARRSADGALEYQGRIDHQVKLRGFRIEIGEIEAALLEHPGVARAVVVMSGERAADQRLVAYVVKAPDLETSWNDLRSFLQAKLPLPMVPTAAIFLDRLPLLPSGKVDRRRLPDPGRNRPRLGASFTSPQSDREKLVAQVWREVLGLDRVGIHDNFFDLGGNSLLAAEVHGKLRERLAGELTLVEMFQHPTVHTLASRLRGQETEKGNLAQLESQVLLQKKASRRRRKVVSFHLENA